MLTLVSNERVPLSDAMRMVFEINSLKNATPATVSRAGILFINESDVGWRPLVMSWVQARADQLEKTYLPQLFDKYITGLVEMTRKGYKEVTPIRLINKVKTVAKRGIHSHALEAGNKVAEMRVFIALYRVSIAWLCAAFGHLAPPSPFASLSPLLCLAYSGDDDHLHPGGPDRDPAPRQEDARHVRHPLQPSHYMHKSSFSLRCRIYSLSCTHAAGASSFHKRLSLSLK